MEKVSCRTPADGKSGVTNIPKWKFDTCRRAILATLADGNVAFKDLSDLVADRLTDEERAKVGSVGWHVTSVKLEMEVRGEIARLNATGPQILCLGHV